MIITTKHIAPWNDVFFLAYGLLIDNLNRSIEHTYPDQDVLLIDNTYLNQFEVAELVKNNRCNIVVILSVLDPPYTWSTLSTHLQETFPDKIFRYVGNESPDVEVLFWYLLCNREFTRYQDVDVLPRSFEYMFLSYNLKPHEHRVKLVQRLSEQDLLKLGYWTLNDKKYESLRSTAPLAPNLGDLDIWQKHFLNIVSMTVFRMNTEPLMVCEKVFKPIIGLRPFVINGSPRYYNVLRQHGFDCFEDIWPVADLCTELDSLEATMNRSHQIICDIVKDLSKDNLSTLYQKLLSRLQYNRDLWYQLASKYDKQYTQELIKF